MLIDWGDAYIIVHDFLRLLALASGNTQLRKKRVLEPFPLVPPRPGQCPECADIHGENDPHNANSLFYQYHFYNRHGRWPTWIDAFRHCSPRIRRFWSDALTERGIRVVAAIQPQEKISTD